MINGVPNISHFRYVSLPASIRDPMIEAYISTLPMAPEAGMSVEDETQVKERRRDRERREKALMEREKRVQEEKRRQNRELRHGKDILRQEEIEMERVMKQVG